MRIILEIDNKYIEEFFKMSPKLFEESFIKMINKYLPKIKISKNEKKID